MESNGLIEKFWDLCEKYFGYQSENPNVDDLAACMLLTYTSVSLKDASCFEILCIEKEKRCGRICPKSHGQCTLSGCV